MSTQLVDSQDLTPVELFAGSFPQVFKKITIASGQNVLAKGTVLGKITETGYYGAYNDAANDGRQTAKLILAEDVDATDAAVECSAWQAGHFNVAALTGYDAAAGVDFEGTPIFTGTIVS